MHDLIHTVDIKLTTAHKSRVQHQGKNYGTDNWIASLVSRCSLILRMMPEKLPRSPS